MVSELIGPWYPASVRRSHEVDALPDSPCVFIVGTWDLARHYRQGIDIRRGKGVSVKIRIISMGARDLCGQLSSLNVPIVISADVRRCAPSPLLKSIEDIAESIDACLPSRSLGECAAPHRDGWVSDLAGM